MGRIDELAGVEDAEDFFFEQLLPPCSAERGPELGDLSEIDPATLAEKVPGSSSSKDIMNLLINLASANRAAESLLFKTAKPTATFPSAPAPPPLLDDLVTHKLRPISKINSRVRPHCFAASSMAPIVEPERENEFAVSRQMIRNSSLELERNQKPVGFNNRRFPAVRDRKPQQYNFMVRGRNEVDQLNENRFCGYARSFPCDGDVRCTTKARASSDMTQKSLHINESEVINRRVASANRHSIAGCGAAFVGNSNRSGVSGFGHGPLAAALMNFCCQCGLPKGSCDNSHKNEATYQKTLLAIRCRLNPLASSLAQAVNERARLFVEELEAEAFELLKNEENEFATSSSNSPDLADDTTHSKVSTLMCAELTRDVVRAIIPMCGMSTHSCSSSPKFPSQMVNPLLGVGGPNFSAPAMLAHPDEFKNPSSFLKVYGDPLCGFSSQIQFQQELPSSSSENQSSPPHPTKGRCGNWTCVKCRNVNYPRRFRCNRCGGARDAEGDKVVAEYAKSVHQHHQLTYKQLDCRKLRSSSHQFPLRQLTRPYAHSDCENTLQSYAHRRSTVNRTTACGGSKDMKPKPQSPNPLP